MINHAWWKDLIFLTLFLGVLFFIFTGQRPLLVPDEGRYAEIAREMNLLHDYVTPWLNEIKYLEKPVLFYWLTAFAIKIGGVNLLSLRSVNALLGLLCSLLTYFTARQLYGRNTGLLAALIPGTSVLYFLMLHMINLDLALTLFLSASLYLFLLGTQQKGRLYFWGAFGAAGLAVLTKGLIGIVFPCLIVSVWMAVTGNWRILKNLYLPSSFVIFLLVILPWHLMMQIRNPEFFSFYIIHEQFLRYSTMVAHHYQPVWYFVPVLIAGFFPWTVFLAQALKSSLPHSWQERHAYQNELFFIVWALVVFVFFSFSKSKLISYILPVIPPLAILTARYLTQKKPAKRGIEYFEARLNAMDGITRHMDVPFGARRQYSIPLLAWTVEQKRDMGFKIGLICLSVTSLVLASLLCCVTHVYAVPDPRLANQYLYSAAAILLTGGIITFFIRTKTKTLAAIVMTSALGLLMVLNAIPALDSRSIRPLATTLRPLLKPDDEVIAFRKYYQDLPFYLERRITVVDWQNEFSFGMQHQDTQQWMIDEKTFWQRWHQHRVYAFVNIDDYKLMRKHPGEKIYLLAQTIHDVLITNAPLTYDRINLSTISVDKSVIKL